MTVVCGYPVSSIQFAQGAGQLIPQPSLGASAEVNLIQQALHPVGESAVTLAPIRFERPAGLA